MATIVDYDAEKHSKYLDATPAFREQVVYESELPAIDDDGAARFCVESGYYLYVFSAELSAWIKVRVLEDARDVEMRKLKAESDRFRVALEELKKGAEGVTAMSGVYVHRVCSAALKGD